MKIYYIMPDLFYFHAIFNLMHEFLYVGSICIPTGMIPNLQVRCTGLITMTPSR